MSPLILPALATLLLASSATLAHSQRPLRDHAHRHNLHIGAAVATREFQGDQPEFDPRYNEVLAREFSAITPENLMKPSFLQPQRGQFDFVLADKFMALAKANAQRVRGHTLVWHMQNGKWLEETPWTRQTLLENMQTHIKTVVGRYKGRIATRDVVNEAISDGAGHGRRDSIYQRIIGDDYIEAAFRVAHEADPGAKLHYNDYGGEGLGGKSDAIYNLVKDFKTRGVPIHGVGLQMHHSIYDAPSDADFRANMRRLHALGLDVHVTEIDIRFPLPVTSEKLEKQAQTYARLLRVFREEGGTEWTFWGFTDAKSWVPKFFKGDGAALIFDENYEKKPAYFAILDGLK